jgi:lanthanide-dependent methanol dehydrogenase
MRYLLTTTCLGAAALFAVGPANANDELIRLQQDAKQWVMPTGNYANQRYSTLKQITSDNVGKLQVAWTFSTGVLRGHEGGPLIIGNVMYVHTPFPNSVYALDLSQDGKILWKYEPKQDPNVIPVMCCDTVNRGPSYADGKIFLHQADTTLVALDAKTGNVAWSVKNGDPAKGETGTSSPMVFKDKVVVGISGGEFGVRGSVTAYNIKDGKQVWRGYSMGPDSDTLIDPQKTTHLGKPVGQSSGTNTWQGEQWKIGGGTTWGWYSYDPELNLMYYGSGNPSTWNPKQRPGDNRWSMTIFARDVDTGQARWLYQMTPHDEWDYDGVNEMILADQQIGGQNRKIVVHFDRNGLAYTLDRTNGELLVAEKYDPKVNWTTGVDMNKNSPTYGRPKVVDAYSTDKQGEDVNTKNICPAALGTKDQQPAAFSPDTGLFYVPTNHVCMDYEPFRVRYTAGQPYVGATLSMYPPQGDKHMGNFIAWDARTGKIVWSIDEQFSVWSGALATAGNVVFYGTLEGYLKAVDAKTGKELYKFKTPSGIIGNVTTYEHGGKQYIAILSGVGGWAGIGLAAGLLAPQEAAGWHGAVHPGRQAGTSDQIIGTAGLGAVGGYAGLRNYTALGGQLTVFALPN